MALPPLSHSLQSGDNDILKRMNRNYTSEEYALLTEIHSQSNPSGRYRADIMAGFSGGRGQGVSQTRLTW